MEKVLLFSDDDKLFEITKRITEGKYDLTRCTFHRLEWNRYLLADAAIIHFDKEKIEKGIFEPIVQIKGKLGDSVPILAVIESESIQEIFSVLKTGVYDYIKTTDNLQMYAKKIEALILWNWYLKNYESREKRGCRNS